MVALSMKNVSIGLFTSRLPGFVRGVKTNWRQHPLGNITRATRYALQFLELLEADSIDILLTPTDTTTMVKGGQRYHLGNVLVLIQILDKIFRKTLYQLRLQRLAHR